MILKTYDINMGSMNPSALTGLLPGGTSGGQTAGTVYTPGVTGGIEPIDRTVLDITATQPAIAGKLLVQVYASTNPQGAQFVTSAVATAQLARFSYGIVYSPPTFVIGTNGSIVYNVGGESDIRCEGVIRAFCTTGGTNAITYGTPLAADGAGNLTFTNSTLPGAVLAVSLGTLPVSQSATLVLVKVGGF